MRKFVSETNSRPRRLTIIPQLVVSDAQADDLSFHHCQCLILATRDWCSLSRSCGLDIFFSLSLNFCWENEVVWCPDQNIVWSKRNSRQKCRISIRFFLTYTTGNKAKSCEKRTVLSLLPILLLFFSFARLCSFVTARNHHHYNHDDRNHHRRAVGSDGDSSTFFSSSPFSLFFLFFTPIM